MELIYGLVFGGFLAVILFLLISALTFGPIKMWKELHWLFSDDEN